MRKRLICLITSLALIFAFVFSSFGLSSYASNYEHISPFSEVKFSASSYPSEFFYSFDYYLLVSYFDSSSNRYQYGIFFIRDHSEDKGSIKVHRDVSPMTSFINDPNYEIYGSSYSPATSSGIVFLSSYTPFDAVTGFVYDNLFSSGFPTFEGVTSYCILASNCDFYDQNGLLLQLGNYDTFLKYFDYTLNAAMIRNFSGHSEPPTTTPDDPGGGGSSSDQTEISNNILTNIKNIFSVLLQLPQSIAEKLGNYFTDLKNSFVSSIENLKIKLLEGIEYLFMPSDNLFTELQEVIETKFEFVYQILDLGRSVISADFLDVPPNNKITLYEKDIVFMDWTLYSDYKSLIDSIIIIVSYYFYIHRLIKRIPGIIGGFHP